MFLLDRSIYTESVLLTNGVMAGRQVGRWWWATAHPILGCQKIFFVSKNLQPNQTKNLHFEIIKR